MTNLSHPEVDTFPRALPGVPMRQLERRKRITGVAVVAVARELAGFLWAEMQA